MLKLHAAKAKAAPANVIATASRKCLVEEHACSAVSSSVLVLAGSTWYSKFAAMTLGARSATVKRLQ
eukprot:4813780-Amphidinium_carterae.1